MLSDLLYRLRAIFRRDQVEGELDEELRFHLERQTQRLIESGLSPQDAERRARLSLGGMEQVKEECRDARGISAFEIAVQDLRYAIRMLMRSPGFTMVAVLSLALGIGANTAVFSVVHAVLLRALPYPEPQRLILLRWLYGESPRPALTIPQMDFVKEHSGSFASMAGYRGGGDRSLVAGAERRGVRTVIITADFFKTLGVSLALGREFNSQEVRPNGPLAVILTDSVWRRWFAADPEVLGRIVTIDDASYTVVGVMPPGFWFPDTADVFMALRAGRTLSDLGTNTTVIARLKPGMALEQAQAEMPAIFEDYRRQDKDDKDLGERGIALVRFQDHLVGDVRLNLLLLFGAAGLLLLIACSNLASVILARLTSRQKEIAVRLALGSSKARLLGQFVVENLLLSVLGGAAGVFCAYWMLRGFVALIPFYLPASTPIGLEWPVLAFAFTVAVATGMLFSLGPFLTSLRIDVHSGLKSGRVAGSGTGRQRTRSILVIAEVALSVTLLISAGLLIQSLYRLHQERLGFTAEGAYTFQTPLAPAKRKNAEQVLSFERNLLARLQTLGAIRSATAINVLPLSGQNNYPTQQEGHPENSIGGMEYRLITPGYFETMEIPVLRGRSFNAGDVRGRVSVVLINETLARRWWPQGDAIGGRIEVGRFQGKQFIELGISDAVREVVGVVADTKSMTLTTPPRPTVYVPAEQATDDLGGVLGANLTWVVRARLSPALADEIRRAVAEIDPSQRVRRMQPMTEIVAATTADSRFDAWLFGSFAAIALVLTAIGVYGLLSFSVAERRQEIGTRMALGATRRNVLGMILRQGVVLMAAGLLLGLAGAAALARSLSTLLYGVKPNDPLSFAVVSIMLLGVGLIASYVPARRATKVDPLVALRYE